MADKWFAAALDKVPAAVLEAIRTSSAVGQGLEVVVEEADQAGIHCPDRRLD